MVISIALFDPLVSSEGEELDSLYSNANASVFPSSDRLISCTHFVL